MTTIACWSLAFVFTKVILQSMSAVSLGFWRYGIASVALGLFAALRKTKPPERKDWGWFILSGLSGFGVYIVIFNTGASYVTAATSSVVVASVPVWTALLASFCYHEKLKRHQWLATLVEFGGILVLCLYDGIFSVNIGVVLLLIGAVLLSVYNVVQRRLTRTYQPFQATTYSIFIGTLFLLIFAPGAIKELKAVSAEVMGLTLVMGVFSSAIAYWAWSVAFAKAEKTFMVSNYMFFTPFLTSVLGFVINKETPDAATLIGGSLIILGALIFHQENLFKHRRS
jgi:drug/metabolite transporter (DMT)-like permease